MPVSSRYLDFWNDLIWLAALKLDSHGIKSALIIKNNINVNTLKIYEIYNLTNYTVFTWNLLSTKWALDGIWSFDIQDLKLSSGIINLLLTNWFLISLFPALFNRLSWKFPSNAIIVFEFSSFGWIKKNFTINFYWFINNINFYSYLIIYLWTCRTFKIIITVIISISKIDLNFWSQSKILMKWRNKQIVYILQNYIKIRLQDIKLLIHKVK